MTWGHIVGTQLLFLCHGSFRALVNRMEAAAALDTGDLLAGVSVQPSLAVDLNS